MTSAVRFSYGQASQSGHAMDLWGPRRVTTLREARRRTALVHIIRLLFTVGAVLSAGLLIGPAVQHAISASAPRYTAPTLAVTMLNPRFEDRDANDKPYVITADTARRRRENVNMIDLVNPKLEDAVSTSVRAREGVFDRTGQVLDLVGDVVMVDAAGYTFTADTARIHVRDNRVEGRTQLYGVGPIGEVRADGYEILDEGDRIVLTGNVWTQFKARRDRPGTAGE